ncbi:MAG: urea active transporter, partial [Thaumarchaeota archaeon]|nr:urea active transporter [Nitrososphaerota archaeon]
MPDADAAGAISGEFKLGEVLDESIGWFIVVGLGMVFAGIISAEIKLEEKYLGHVQSSEAFNTAGRVIKTGLTAAAIVS